jgi:hypothetical protein
MYRVHVLTVLTPYVSKIALWRPTPPTLLVWVKEVDAVTAVCYTALLMTDPGLPFLLSGR